MMFIETIRKRRSWLLVINREQQMSKNFSYKSFIRTQEGAVQIRTGGSLEPALGRRTPGAIQFQRLEIHSVQH